jgi:hypothetical protein
MASALLRGDPASGRIVRQSLAAKVKEIVTR